MCVHHGSFAPSMFHNFIFICLVFYVIYLGFISFDGVYIHTVDPTADLQSSRFYSLNRTRAV